MEFINDLPIYLQIMDMIKADIATGKIKKGDQLPSTRELAMELQVNPNTIQRVYRELEMEQVCFTKRGTGTFVTESDDTVKKMREDLAQFHIGRFVSQMDKLEFTIADIIERLRMIEEGKQ